MNNIDNLFFAKTKNQAIVPSKRSEDAGYDLYSCFEEANITLFPGDITLVPTGICMAFSSNYVFFIKERSSTGVIGLSTRMGVIDSGFRGEIMIGLNNTSNKIISIEKNISSIAVQNDIIRFPYTKAIAQGVLCVIPKVNVVEVSHQEILSFNSARGVSYMGASEK
jgi:dUTP pyrophosphatase